MADHSVSIAVFGLGEAGTAVSAGLAAKGATVRGYDPAQVPDPPGVLRCASPKEAVSGAAVVLSLTAEADMESALGQALHDISPGCLYVDMGTAAPSVKRKLCDSAEEAGLSFVDVAIMAPILAKGLSTPALASGPGATRFVPIAKDLGMDVTAVSEEAGVAASRKLLRSVVVKGIAALFIEAMRAGEAAGCGDWLWAHLCAQVQSADETFVRRIVASNGLHGARRTDEMRASSRLLEELGVEPLMTRSTAEVLSEVASLGLPGIPTESTS